MCSVCVFVSLLFKLIQFNLNNVCMSFCFFFCFFLLDYLNLSFILVNQINEKKCMF